MIARVTLGHKWDERLGTELFALLVPWRLQEHAAEGRDLVLRVGDPRNDFSELSAAQREAHAVDG